MPKTARQASRMMSVRGMCRIARLGANHDPFDRSLAGLVFSIAVVAAPARGPDDPLVVDSKWVGKLTQKGKIEGNEVPLTLDAELTVTKRDGTKFEGELREWNDNGIKLTYLVKGEVVKS